jgi:ABC-2 type transport system permease protein
VRGFWPIFKRELFALFVTPLAWVAITSFLLLQGLHFFLIIVNFATAPADSMGDSGPVQSFFGQTMLMYVPLLVVCPLLTMRSFAEERRSGTIESLLTAPVGSAGVTLAKYAAPFVTYAAMWAPTLLYMVVILMQKGEIDWRVVGTSYATVLAIGGGYLSIGVMTSALSQSQLTAAVLSALAISGLFFFGMAEFIIPDGAVHDIATHLSVWTQMNDASRGLLDSRRLVYDATVIALPLFITTRAVDAWRWG